MEKLKILVWYERKKRENLVDLPFANTKMPKVVFWPWITFVELSSVEDRFVSIMSRIIDFPNTCWKRKNKKARYSPNLVWPIMANKWPMTLVCSRDKTCLRRRNPRVNPTTTHHWTRKKAANNSNKPNYNERWNDSAFERNGRNANSKRNNANCANRMDRNENAPNDTRVKVIEPRNMAKNHTNNHVTRRKMDENPNVVVPTRWRRKAARIHPLVNDMIPPMMMNDDDDGPRN
mmetsp:Transcript_30493/g.63659  ORF Transcript_30493/g.63659 Transcript_30493/m.63659 type:complete len:233 (-) Transcript_30493:302-1000(-)